MSIETIQQDEPSYGNIRYFYSDRCENLQSLRDFNRGKIAAKELVTFDCGLMEMKETPSADTACSGEYEQLLAIIIRPEEEPDSLLKADHRFEFCGYDVVDTFCYISAITNCGAEFEQAVDYASLNSYGLIPSYPQARHTQQKLTSQYPQHSHSDCELVEIWRWLPDEKIKLNDI